MQPRTSKTTVSVKSNMADGKRCVNNRNSVPVCLSVAVK